MLGVRQASERLADVNTVLVDIALRIQWVLELNLHLCLDTQWNRSLIAASMFLSAWRMRMIVCGAA